MPTTLIRVPCTAAERLLLANSLWDVVHLPAKGVRIHPWERMEVKAAGTQYPYVAVLEEVPAPCPAAGEADPDTIGLVVTLLLRPAVPS
jgi:hypothetical protein